MMIKIGNFFFQYRNWVFIPLYLALFIPSAEVLTTPYHAWVLVIGLTITISGQAIRGATIGLAYIKRGGLNKKVYAANLVTEGIFNHCRNPLYVGRYCQRLYLDLKRRCDNGIQRCLEANETADSDERRQAGTSY